MTNNGSINQDSTAIRAAELAVIDEVVSTVGDVISTIAAMLALEEERQDERDNNHMQKQIDDLTAEFENLKKQVNKDSTH